MLLGKGLVTDFPSLILTFLCSPFLYFSVNSNLHHNAEKWFPSCGLASILTLSKISSIGEL